MNIRFFYKCKMLLNKFMTVMLALIMIITLVPITKVSAESQVDKVVNFALSMVGKSEYSGKCQAFVSRCYNEAGIDASKSTATLAYQAWCISSSISNIPRGAAVYFSDDNPAGHVGLYVGNNEFVHARASVGKICKNKLTESYYKSHYLGWGWNGGKALDGTDTNIPTNTNCEDYYKLTAPDGFQTVRSSANSSSTSVGTINAGTVVCITKYNSDKSWGYLSYNGISGWIRLYYVEKTTKPHTHYYESGYEAAHPHRVYMKCSCGDYYYTGETKTIDNCETCHSCEDYYLLTAPDGFQTVRSSASTSSSSVGTINAGTVVCITKYNSDKSWGYLSYNGISGWIRLYYVTKTEKPHTHTGGTADCSNKAKCSACGKEYGDYGSHKFTIQAKSENTLKVAGTCTDKAIFYYCCSVCGACERNDAHVFYGDYEYTNHDGETEIRNAKEATCCESGYTGDTYCKNCNAKLSSGSVIPATGHHTDIDGKWETDGTQHWHTCYYGTQFDVASHTGGTATCAEKAKCSICGAEYGEYGAHHLTHHDRVEPDYENEGNIEYWTCDECGRYFDDSEGNNEISADDVIIAKLIVSKYQFIDGEVIIEAPTGAIPEGSLFDVQKIVPPPAEVVEKVKEQMGSSSEVLAYYEIRLSDTDGELIIHLDGEITIKIQMPEKYAGSKCVKVLQEDETGKLITMESWWEGEYLCYKTDWLEIYN